MAKGNNNPGGRRSSSRNTKPYDANNSFVKKVATKVSDLIPQRSWISKWFNTSQNEGEDLEDNDNPEEVESEEDIQKPPPLKRPCIRMDVPHPPGTFSIQPRTKPTKPNSTAGPTKQQYSVRDETSDDFCKPVMAGPSGMSHLVSSTPATHTNIRNAGTERSELNSLVTTANNGTANGMDDNSESSESTSGCSSLIPQTNRQEAPSNTLNYNSTFANNKRFHDDKLSFANHMQSPRSLFLDNSARDSLSSRRPSFNASVMTNTPDRASPLASPFYSGNITFGGANAAGLYKRGRNLFNSANEIQLSVPKRTCVEVKPSTTAGVDSSGMSQTAKKILEALEHFSSPITDAKKIPLKMMNNTSSKKRTRDETVTTKVGFRHLTRELTVPTVPDILKLRRRQKLQDTTAAARKIVSARSETPTTQEYQLRTQDTRKDHGFKCKGTYLEEELVEPVNLPNIPLPISSLPNFNFMQPPTTKATDKITPVSENTFVFTSPIKISNAVKDLKSINNFTFSSPINADRQLVEDSEPSPKKVDVKSNEPSSDCVPSVAQNFVWSGSSTAPRPKEKVKSKAPLKTGSVLDVLGGTKTEKSCDANANVSKESNNDKTVSDTVKQDTVKKAAEEETNSVWECPECLSKNSSSEAQCFACKATRSNVKDKKTSAFTSVSSNANESKTAANDSFGSQFKLTGTQWECTSCLVRNKQTDVKCVACNTPKPDAKQGTKSDAVGDDKHVKNTWECPDCKSKIPNTSFACSSCDKSKSKMTGSQNDGNVTESKKVEPYCVLPNFKDENMFKSKVTKDLWECPSCMVRNATSVETCVCCQTAKPNAGTGSKSDPPASLANGFGDKFKKPEGAWSCDTCMVQNESNVTECVACGGLKPGAKKTENTAPATSSSSLQFAFGMPANTGGFKFGIDKAGQEKADSASASTNGFKFGESPQSGSAGQFMFGIQKEEKKSEAQKPESTSKPSSGFGFTTGENSGVKQDSETAAKKPTPVFTFGIPKSDSAATESDKQPQTSATAPTTISSTFTFGAPKPVTVQLATKEEKQSPLAVNSTTEVSKPNKEATVPPPAATSAATLSSITRNVTQEPTKPTATFPFGLPSGTVAISSTTTVVSSLPSSTQSSFMFMEPKATTQTAPSVTFPTTTASTSTLPSTFKFGESKAKEEPKTFGDLQNAPRGSLFSNMASYPTPSFTNNDSKAAPTFGQMSTGNNEQPTFGAASTSKPSTFGTAGTSNKPSTFAMPENKVPAFGSAESKPPIFGSTETKMPVFESTETKPTSLFNPTPQVAAGPTPTPTPFGTPSAAPSLFGAPTSVTPVFGNNTAPTFTTESTPNIFGSTSKTNETTAPNTNLFTFCTTPAQPVAKPTTGFNFSATANPSEPPKPLFVFGSTLTTPQTGNLFGNTFNNPAASSNTSGFTFNASKPETPAFAQPPATNTIFGTSQPDAQNQASSSFSAAPASTGFNFGTTATPASSTGGFNFGAAPAAAPSTGFNFNPPNSTPTFDPNTPPSFNFTGGNAPTGFNAPPMPQRKFKKAIRRMRT